MPALRERISGGLVGLLVGDALGVPYEFHSPAALPESSLIEFTPPADFHRSHSSVPPGTWSDDGAQALCLLSTLLGCGSLNLKDFAGKLLRWYHDAAFTPDGRRFDCGLQTREALRQLEKPVPPDCSGPAGEYDNGNGSLMRVLPLALWHTGSDEALCTDAKRQSSVTHGHLRSQLCCALYVLWARELLQGADEGWDSAAEKLRVLSIGDPAEAHESEFILSAIHRDSACGSGYVLNALWSARIALEEPNYTAVVRKAIAFGNDTDTTACIAGGLAGIRDGITAIPARWRNSLHGRQVYEPLLKGLLAVRDAS
jgi:ADP-ribosyl-[dinitrogen reductase] hydrolase